MVYGKIRKNKNVKELQACSYYYEEFNNKTNKMFTAQVPQLLERNEKQNKIFLEPRFCNYRGEIKNKTK